MGERHLRAPAEWAEAAVGLGTGEFVEGDRQGWPSGFR
jgi:hypothetical protein